LRDRIRRIASLKRLITGNPVTEDEVLISIITAAVKLALKPAKPPVIIREERIFYEKLASAIRQILTMHGGGASDVDDAGLEA